MNKKEILAKIINNKSLCDYFYNKDYKKKSFLKYCYNKTKNFNGMGLLTEYTLAMTILGNIMSVIIFVMINILFDGTGVNSFSYINEVILPLMFTASNFVLCMGLLSIPFYIVLTGCKFILKKRNSLNDIEMVDMNSYLSIEDHEQIALVLSREEFVYFLVHIKQYKDLPLYKMKEAITSSLESELKKAENERLMVGVAKRNEKIENYTNLFYKK